MDHSRSLGKERVSTRWIVNDTNARIPSEIKGIKQALSFNINVKKTLKDGASSIFDWKSGACEEYFSAFFQAYIELGRRMFEESRKMVQLWKRYRPEVEITDVPIECFVEAVVADPSKIDPPPKKPIFTDLTFHMFVRKIELPEIVATSVKNHNTDDQDNSKEAHDQQGDNEDDDQDDEDSEQVTFKKKRGKRKKKAKTPKIPDKDIPVMDARVLWARMIEEIINLHQGANNNKSPSTFGRAAKSALKELKPFEKWKMIKSIPLLAHLYDFYTNQTNAALNYEKFNTTTLDTESNLFCATTLFSRVTLACARSRDCVDQQSAESIARTMMQWDGLEYTIRPTLRKYWLKVNPAEWTPESMYNRVLPWKQGDQMERLSAALPLILEDYQSHSNIFSRFSHQNTPQKQQQATENDDIRISFDGQDLQLLPAESEDFKQQQKSSDRNRQALREMITEMNLQEIFSVDGPSYDVNSFEAVNGRSIGTYITPAVQNYICEYSHLIEFGQSVDKALNALYNRLMNPRGNLYGKFKNPLAMLYKLRRLSQQYLFKEFVEKCRSETSDISPIGRKMYQYLKDSSLYSKAPLIKYEKKDKSLSMYANWEIVQYAYEDQLNFVAGTHRFHRLANKYKLDAYRADFDIHLSMFTNSERGATGKSWLWNKMIKHSIPGSVIQETHRSNQAEMIDSLYESDEIVVFHEIDTSLINEHNGGKGGENDRARMFKERWSSQKTFSRRHEIDPETKVRYTKEVETERITVFFGSTNKDLDAIMDPAMRSRVHAISYQDNIHFKNISALTVIENILSSTDKSVAKLLVTESHLIQMLVFEVEKMILCRIIQAPSTHVSNIILLLLQESLSEKGMCKASTRDIMRTQIYARLNCILDAIISTFFFPGGKHYGKEIVPEMLLDLEPLLYCKVQHVVSAIGEQIDLYVDETESNVLKIIRAMIELQPQMVQFKQSYQYGLNGGSDDHSKSGNSFHRKIGLTMAEDPNYFSFKKKVNHEFPLMGVAETLNSFGKTLAVSSLESNKKKNSKHTMDQAEVPSTFSIMRVLKNWCDKTITARRYNRDNATKEVEASLKPPVTQAVAENGDRYWYHLHYEFVMGPPRISDDDQMTNTQKTTEFDRVIQAEEEQQHEDQDSDERRIQEWGKAMSVSEMRKKTESRALKHAGLFGREAIKKEIENILCRRFQLPQRLLFDVDNRTGYIRNVIEITEDMIKNAPYLVIPSPIHMDEICSMLLSDKIEYLDEFRRARGIMIGTDLDTYGMMERKKALYICDEAVSPKFREMDFFRFDSERSSLDDSVSDSKYLYTDEDYDDDEKAAYFLGRHLQRNIDFEEMSQQKDISVRIENMLEKLDQEEKEETEQEDDDAFHPSDYIVREGYVDAFTEEQVQPLYHWQLDSMSKELFNQPTAYKSVCTHPMMVEWFVDEKFYVQTPMNVYPGEAIKNHEDRKKKQYNLMKEISQNDESMKRALRECVLYCAERGIQVDQDHEDIVSKFAEVTALSSAAASRKRSLTYLRGLEKSNKQQKGEENEQSDQEEKDDEDLSSSFEPSSKKQKSLQHMSLFAKARLFQNKLPQALVRQAPLVLNEVSQTEIPDADW